METQKKLRIYKTKQGKEPFTKWLGSLKDRAARMQIRRRLDRLMLGHYGDCKTLDSGIKELRLHYGPGYRIYIVDVDNIIVILLCAGTKSSQVSDIEKAKTYWQDLKERNDEN